MRGCANGAAASVWPAAVWVAHGKVSTCTPHFVRDDTCHPGEANALSVFEETKLHYVNGAAMPLHVMSSDGLNGTFGGYLKRRTCLMRAS